MAEVIKEDFKQNLFAKPSGQRKTQPTIFDELRWALQHTDKPLEQVLQLISEFHGAWTGSSNNLMNLLTQLSGDVHDKNYIKLATDALKIINNSKTSSNIGRVNNITASQMPVELLREFVSRSQSIHPSVNTYIQMNIGKYPYFQQISESICSFGQSVLQTTDSTLIDRVASNGDQTMQSSYRLRRNTNNKLFDNIKKLVDDSDNILNCLFLRACPVENSMHLLNTNYGKSGSPISHGHGLCMDVFNQQRIKDSIQPSISKATAKFGPSLELCNWAFPISYEISKKPELFTLTAEGKNYTADGFNRPIFHEPEIPIASDDNKTQIS